MMNHEAISKRLMSQQLRNPFLTDDEIREAKTVYTTFCLFHISYANLSILAVIIRFGLTTRTKEIAGEIVSVATAMAVISRPLGMLPGA